MRCTRSRVSVETWGRLRTARETVAVETPAARATSLMLAAMAAHCALSDGLGPTCGRADSVDEALQHRDRAVLVDRAGHLIRRGLDGVVGVPHGDAPRSPREHLDVVAPVADGHRLVPTNAEPLPQHLESARLGDARRGEVEPRGPTDGVSHLVQAETHHELMEVVWRVLGASDHHPGRGGRAQLLEAHHGLDPVQLALGEVVADPEPSP